jgi:hypothetical protein
MKLSQKRINLSGPDKHVPYVAKIKRADYVVTSDQNVLEKTEKIRKTYLITYMKPMTNVFLIHYLHVNGKLKFEEYAKIVLEYFKYEEMKNIYDAIKNPDRGWELKEVRDRVQWYKDPLLEALKERIDGAQAKVKMYG